MTHSAPLTLDAQLQAALLPDPAPGDLRSSLLAAGRRADARRRWPAFWAAAVFTLAVGWGTVSLLKRQAEGDSRLIHAALRNHLDVQRLDFVPHASEACCKGVCRRWSPDAVGFCAELPRCLENQPLAGGRVCTLAGRRAAYYLLRDGRAVYVFASPLRGVTGAAPLTVAAGLQARAWNEDGHGYVLVEPPGK